MSGFRLIRGLGAGLLIGGLLSINFIAAIGALLLWIGIMGMDEYYKDDRDKIKGRKCKK